MEYNVKRGAQQHVRRGKQHVKLLRHHGDVSDERHPAPLAVGGAPRPEDCFEKFRKYDDCIYPLFQGLTPEEIQNQVDQWDLQQLPSASPVLNISGIPIQCIRTVLIQLIVIRQFWSLITNEIHVKD